MKILIVLFAFVCVVVAKPGFPVVAYSALPRIHSYTPTAYSFLGSPYYSYNSLALASPALHAVVHAPPVFATPGAVGVQTQYHLQDEHGQASYGHSELLQNHNAIQDAHGNKVGSFSYTAPNGQVFRTDYVADALGYRVSSNALPVGPSADSKTKVSTPEVVAGQAVHYRAKRGIVAVGHTPASTSPLRGPAVRYSAPLVYSAPVAYTAYATHHVYPSLRYAFFR